MRLFPDPGHYPFPTGELLAALAFCALGAALTWRVERARLLQRALHRLRRSSASLAYVIPSNLGENVVRLRFAAVPIAVPRLLAPPLAADAARRARARARLDLERLAARSTASPAARTTRPRRAPTGRRSSTSCTARSSPDYRVEAVGTADHWEAVYLPQAGIPIVRGWFRQDDFPQNEVLYDKLTRRSYLAWLRRSERPLRRAHRRGARLQRQARGRPARRAAAPGSRSCSSSADATIYAVPVAAPDRHRARAPAGRGADRVARSRSRSRARAATSSASATRPISPRRRRASPRRRTG